MPTYDYVCDACGVEFELFQSIKDNPKKKCDECGKPKLRRKFGIGAAVMFKGSGFYTTDYRSEAYKKQASADQSAAQGSSSESKSETKSETKSENNASSGSSAKPEKKSHKK